MYLQSRAIDSSKDWKSFSPAQKLEFASETDTYYPAPSRAHNDTSASKTLKYDQGYSPADQRSESSYRQL